MRSLGDAWSSVLPGSHRQALQSALAILVDGFFQDLLEIEEGNLDFGDSWLGSSLPSKYALRYTPLFQKRFFACLLTVGWKLGQPRRSTPLLSCTAEELALHALIEKAEAVLEMEGMEADFDLFKDFAFEDLDYEVLFDAALDGMEDSDAGVVLGMGSLHFDEWFRPFASARTAVHPFAADED